MTPAEVALAIQAFLELEPEVQKGIVGLIHLIHNPKPTIPPVVIFQPAPVATVPGTPSNS
jgi:hypothetical protein